MKLDSFQTGWAKSVLLLALIFIVALPNMAGAQQTPDVIVSISPTSTIQGDTGVVVTITYIIVDTDQVKCYNNMVEVTCPAPGEAFYGQDAQYAGVQPSYTDNGDGTVTDLNTGLIWQQSPDTDGDGDIDAADKRTFAQAQTYCQDLDLAGYTDWQLAGIKELYSLIEFSGTDPSGCANELDCPNLVPFIDTDYFDFAYGDTGAGERLIDAQYASRDLYVGNTGMLFGVNFADGRIKGYGLTMPGGGEKTFYVQCVLGDTGYGVNNFSDNGDDTIADQATGLMWSQADSGAALNWEEALAWVQAQNAAGYLGYDDLRLPNAKELQGIIDYSRSPDSSASAAIDPLFSVTSIVNEGGAVDYPYYWTSTTHAMYNGSGGAGVYLSFGRALGWMRDPGDNCYTLYDVHGAGAQRGDPKSGSPSSYYLGPSCSGGPAYGRGPQGDLVRIDNYVRLVRDMDLDPQIPVQILSLTATPAECVVSFAAEVTGTEPIAWWWDFGSWGTATTTNPVVDFGGSGTYPYTLTVSNGARAYSDTASGTIAVTCCTPVQDAAFSWQPPMPLVGEVVTFSGGASGTAPIAFAWDWGDGSSGTGAVLTHTYATAGDYAVTLTATNGCAEETVRHTLTLPTAKCLSTTGGGFWRFGSLSQALPPIDRRPTEVQHLEPQLRSHQLPQATGSDFGSGQSWTADAAHSPVVPAISGRFDPTPPGGACPHLAMPAGHGPR